MATKREQVFSLLQKGHSITSKEVKEIVSSYPYRKDLWADFRKAYPEMAEAISEVEGNAELDQSKEAGGEGKAPHLKAPLHVSPKFINIAHIQIPYSDWGYSSTFGLLIVAATYEEVCRPPEDGGYGYSGKVGDFCADCVTLFRRIFNFDKLKEEEHEGGRILEGSGKAELVEQ